MKLYCSDFNGILTDLKNKIGPAHLTNPRDADALIIWQDVLGSYGDLIKSMKKCGIEKPVFTVQHGRAATSDYDKPNSYPLSSDYYLCWGINDFKRMSSLGYGSRTKIIGCPLNIHIKPKIRHDEKIILFVPVNTGKEEPENIATYYKLLEMRYAKACNKVRILSAPLKDSWKLNKSNGKDSISFNDFSSSFDVVAKLLPWHDRHLYHGNVISGNQYDPQNNRTIFELLRNVDMVVGLDEGCTEIFAMAHDVPVVVVNGFKYRQYKLDGKTYEETGVYTTKGATHVDLEILKEVIEYGLTHPEYLRTERAQVARQEMGTNIKDPVSNIYNFVKEKVKCVTH